MKHKILIVDDEWNMRNLIRIHLSNENYELDEAADGKGVVKKVQHLEYDLIILDIMLPDMDGWGVCSTIRKTNQTPILMLTARNDVEDRVRGLNLGADDYLSKPFAPEELVARVNALLRRQEIRNENKTNIHFENLSINSESREVMVSGKPVELTPKEFDILYLVASQPKRVFTRDMLLDKIWHPSDFRDLRAVDTHVKNIREKLRKSGLTYNPIKTVWGVGYKFNTLEDQT
ncbi:response regulator transcription factor [Lentibacillus cibarius]|uniref:Response regulator transcription factor n=1 Tax=Lentibacillus cibarius TaxID=2583219 RepID=A0A549YJT1_9BACI|nr:response regulator transcription factor [Lentibacillus cibarius]TRM12138.1 response regulator transcription factor [Lentibacillus cibarius]